MALNDTELEAVVESLRYLVGAPIAGVWQPRRDRVIVGVGANFLLLVPRGPYARLHTLAHRPRNPGNPFSFQGACRALLKGRLEAISKSPDDREVSLKFGEHELLLRLSGRSGGLWIRRGERVLAAYDGPAPASLPPLPPKALGVAPRKPRFAPAADESWEIAAARWFGTREREARLHERRTVLRRRLRTALARDRRLLTALRRDLDKADGAERLRQQADGLAAVLHTVQRGTTTVDVTSLEDGTTRWCLRLDPTRSPGENLSRLYKRVGRLERAGDRIIEHIDRVEARIRVVDAAVAVVPEADAALLKQLEALAPATGQRRQAQKEQPWHVWSGPHGATVLVGKNARGNRRLTFQKARGDDYWFHIRGVPGAHVLLPQKRGKTPDLNTLLAVAQICLAHAKIPEGSSADVQYTKARHVSSIKGAADGRVQVHAEKVLRVTRDPTVLVGWNRDGAENLNVAGLSDLTNNLAGDERGHRSPRGEAKRP